jgi:hypothetical protein
MAGGVMLVRWGLGARSAAPAVFLPMATGVVVYAAYVRLTPLWSVVGAMRARWGGTEEPSRD